MRVFVGGGEAAAGASAPVDGLVEPSSSDPMTVMKPASAVPLVGDDGVDCWLELDFVFCTR